jgi:hypothetical protein
MNTYILPCYSLNDSSLWVEKTRARSFSEAEDKFINLFVEDYELDTPTDWDELVEMVAKEQEMIIGDIYDVEEF